VGAMKRELRAGAAWKDTRRDAEGLGLIAKQASVPKGSIPEQASVTILTDANGKAGFESCHQLLALSIRCKGAAPYRRDEMNYSDRVKCKSCESGTGPNGCTDCLNTGRDFQAFANGIDQALNDAYAEGRKDEREESGKAVDILLRRIDEVTGEKRDLFCRFLGLLKELHESETLSEQQCAAFLGVDLLTWREESQGPYTPHAFAQEGRA
jgi:hypothetical protein